MRYRCIVNWGLYPLKKTIHLKIKFIIISKYSAFINFKYIKKKQDKILFLELKIYKCTLFRFNK